MALHDPKEFLDLVSRMRGAQKQYFKTRDRDVLQLSKQLERQVDQYIEAQRRPGLFED